MKHQSLLATLLLMLPMFCMAQQANVNLDWDPHRNHEGLTPYGAVSNSPEVHDDRSVTFRLKAPEAGHVELTGAIRSAMDTDKPLSFAKDDAGVWSLTVDPLPPDIYSYEFLIDGVAVADPGNTYAAVMAAPPASQVVIHGDEPAWYDARNVPHGKVTRHVYHSAVTTGERELYVYTPPAYDPMRRYPVLYLVGGSSSLASDWIFEGRVNFIMDNLLAEGSVEPMIIAVPNNQMLHRNHPSHEQLTFDLFERELREEVIPLVDREYGTRAEAKGRALAGFSMGGRHAMFIGLRSPDIFASLGILSAGDERAETSLAAFLEDPAANTNFDLLFVGQGGDEAVQPFFNARVAALVAALKAHGIDHEYYVGGTTGHDWPTWRHLLYYRFLTGLWRQ
jgi:enterochelin esterase-like enzyme